MTWSPFSFDRPAGYRYLGGKMLPARNTVNEILDRAFVDGEAAIVMKSLADVDAFSDALFARAKSLTGNEHSITVWGLDELPEKYTLRVAWIAGCARS